MEQLRRSWGNFLTITLSPWFLVFSLVTIASLVFSATYKENVSLSNLLAVLGSVAGGLAGGIFQNEYNKLLGQSILEKKGQSAVRNMMSLQKQIHSLRAWIGSFSKSCNKEDRHQLDEVDRHLSTIELNLNSGYEDWIDIIPQLRQEKEIHEKYGAVFRSYATELLDQRLKLAQAANETERSGLEKKISALEKQLKDWKKEKNDRILISSIGGGAGNHLSAGTFTETPSFSYMHGLPSYTPFCSRCGTFLDMSLDSPTSALVAGENLCDNCRKKTEKKA